MGEAVARGVAAVAVRMVWRSRAAHLEVSHGKHAEIGGDLVAHVDSHDIACHEVSGRDLRRLAIANDVGLLREHVGEALHGLRGVGLLHVLEDAGEEHDDAKHGTEVKVVKISSIKTVSVRREGGRDGGSEACGEAGEEESLYKCRAWVVKRASSVGRSVGRCEPPGEETHAATSRARRGVTEVRALANGTAGLTR